ncbi:hypothetical protein [Streptomyces sp. NPDC088766]|uniref:hypothetical protein n=1 Tax=Streptomyces sp. NPDC088766 TaxID=3365893 RepID=UPI0037F261AC
MNRPTGSGAARPRLTRRRCPAALATAPAGLLPGAAGRLTGPPAEAAETHPDNPFAGADLHADPDRTARADAPAFPAHVGTARARGAPPA